MSDAENHYTGSVEDLSKPGLLSKKKKKSEKPGYRMFDADSDNEPVVYDDSNKVPVSKLKKHSRPSFKFAGKLNRKEKEKEDKKGEKEEKDSTRLKTKSKDKEKDKENKPYKKKGKPAGYDDKVLRVPTVVVQPEAPVFGVTLSLAVERTPSNDGVLLPVVVRECIDYVEEHGLLYEGIYRISGVKSKVQMLKDCYNTRQPTSLYEHDPSIIASLLKQFIRELPEPVLTTQLTPMFEEASVIMNHRERLERLEACISSLPPCNQALLSWMVIHMNHVIAKEKINKMSLQNVSIVLSPTMRISHRVLNVLFLHSEDLFKHVEIIKYKASLQPALSRWSVDLPDTHESIQEELKKLESHLNHLHQELQRHAGDSEREERLWEVQRNITQLKRKLKLIDKTNAAKQLEKQLSTEDVRRTDPNRRSINAAELNFALNAGSLHRSRKTSEAHLSALHSQSSESLPTQGAISTQASIPAQGTVPLRISTSAQEAVPAQAPAPTHAAVAPQEPRPSQRLSELLPQDAAELPQAPVAQPPATITQDTSEDELRISAIEQTDREPNDSDTSTQTHEHMFITNDRAKRLLDHIPESVASTEDVENLESKSAVIGDYHKFEPVEELGVEQPAPLSDVKEDMALNEAALEDSALEGSLQIPSLNLTQQTVLQGLTVSDESHVAAEAMVLSEKEASLTNLLIPEKLHSVSAELSGCLQHSSQVNQVEYSLEDDEELRYLIAEEAKLIWEEEELIAIKDELNQKIAAETLEIERLTEEIAEYEELRSVTTLGHSSEGQTSDYSSTSDTDPSSDAEHYRGDCYQELDELVAELEALKRNNSYLEIANSDLVKKLDEERLGCLNIKIQIRLLQQQKLSYSWMEEQSLI